MSRLLLLLLLLGAARGGEPSRLEGAARASAGLRSGVGAQAPSTRHQPETFDAVGAVTSVSDLRRTLKPGRNGPRLQQPLPNVADKHGDTAAAHVQGERLYKMVRGAPGIAPAGMEAMLPERVINVIQQLVPAPMPRVRTFQQDPTRESEMGLTVTRPPKNKTLGSSASQRDTAKIVKGGCNHALCTGSASIPRNLSKERASFNHRPVSMVTRRLRQDSDSPEQTHQPGSEGNVQSVRGDGFTRLSNTPRLAVSDRRRTGSGLLPPTTAVPGRTGQAVDTFGFPPELPATDPPSLGPEASLPHSLVTRESVQPVAMATGASKTFTEEKVSDSEYAPGMNTTSSIVKQRLLLLRTEPQQAKQHALASPGTRRRTIGLPTPAELQGSPQDMPFTGTGGPYPLPIPKSPETEVYQTSTKTVLPPLRKERPWKTSVTSVSTSDPSSRDGVQNRLNFALTSVPSRGPDLTDIFQKPAKSLLPFPKSTPSESVFGYENGNQPLLEMKDEGHFSWLQSSTPGDVSSPKLSAQVEQQQVELPMAATQLSPELTTPVDNSLSKQSTLASYARGEPTHRSPLQQTTKANEKLTALSTSKHHFLPVANRSVNQIPLTQTRLANQYPQEVTKPANQIPPATTQTNHYLQKGNAPENKMLPIQATKISQTAPELTAIAEHFATVNTTAPSHPPKRGTRPAKHSHTDLATPENDSPKKQTTTEPSYISKHFGQSPPDLTPSANYSPTEIITPAKHTRTELYTYKKHPHLNVTMPTAQSLSEQARPPDHYTAELNTPVKKTQTELATPANNYLLELTVPEVQTPRDSITLPKQQQPKLSTQAELSTQSSQDSTAPEDRFVPKLTLSFTYPSPELTMPVNQTLPSLAPSLKFHTTKQTSPTGWLSSYLTVTDSQVSSQQATYTFDYFQGLTILPRHPLAKHTITSAQSTMEFTRFTGQSQDQKITTTPYLPKHSTPDNHKHLKQRSTNQHFPSSKLTTPMTNFTPNPNTTANRISPELVMPSSQFPQEQTTLAASTLAKLTTSAGSTTLDLTTAQSHTTLEPNAPFKNVTTGLMTLEGYTTSELNAPKDSIKPKVTTTDHSKSKLPTPTGHTTSGLSTSVSPITSGGDATRDLTTPTDPTTSDVTTIEGQITSKLSSPTDHATSTKQSISVDHTSELITPVGHIAPNITTIKGHTTSEAVILTSHSPSISSATTQAGPIIANLTTPMGHITSELTRPMGRITLEVTTPTGNITSNVTAPAGHTLNQTRLSSHTTTKLSTSTGHTTSKLISPTGHPISDSATQTAHMTSKLATPVRQTTSPLTTHMGRTTSTLSTPAESIPPDLTASEHNLTDVTTPVFYPQSSLSYDTVTQKYDVSTEKREPFLTTGSESNGSTQWTLPFQIFHTSKKHRVPNLVSNKPSSHYTTTNAIEVTSEESSYWQGSSSGHIGGSQAPEDSGSWQASPTALPGSSDVPGKPSPWYTPTTRLTGGTKVLGGQGSWHRPSTGSLGGSELQEEHNSQNSHSIGPNKGTKVLEESQARFTSSTGPTGSAEEPEESSSWQVSSTGPAGPTLKIPDIYLSRAHNDTGRVLKPLEEEAPTGPVLPEQSGPTNFEVTAKSLSTRTSMIYQRFPSTSPHSTHRTRLSTSHHATSRVLAERSGRIFIVEDQPPILKAREVNVTFHLALEMDFTETLESVDSLQRRALVLAFQDTVSPFYKSVPGFMQLEVLSIREGSVILDYVAVFNVESVNLLMVEQPDRLLNLSHLPEAIASGLWVAGHRVMGISSTERWADLCSTAYSCLAGFACAHHRNGSITCTSLCHDGFCKNDGICTHRRGGEPMCQCPVGSDYWFMGVRCDYRMTQQALLGISCGVILTLVLCISAIAYLAMRRFKALLLETKINQTKSSYRRFSRFDDISTRYWSHSQSQSQSWLGASISSLDNLAFSHSEEVLHLHAMESRRGSSPEDADHAGTCSPRSTPHHRPECRPGFEHGDPTLTARGWNW
ncbi:mucin-2-like isoform X3 [Ambystoma mexicanum]|uniref:mucin-2-like isoform X3 n=1 Tax=Ambystoma mexicanum TaxID=8296 RepID=UPI0037E708F8